MTLTIFTSLPPVMNRFDQAGHNIGAEHYHNCLQSWRNSGFDIVSINSASEPIGEIESKFPVIRESIKHDAKDICGKPLVFLSDFLKTAHRYGSGPIVITNSDIEIFASDDVKETISSIKPGTFIFESRYDYRYEDKKRARPYQGGFDFFVIHRDDLPLLFDTGLVFGMPWWDHYIPITLLAFGHKRVRLQSNSTIFHRVHDERWNLENYIKFGQLFQTALSNNRNSAQMSDEFRTYLEILDSLKHFKIHHVIAYKENLIRLLARRKFILAQQTLLELIVIANFLFINE